MLVFLKFLSLLLKILQMPPFLPPLTPSTPNHLVLFLKYVRMSYRYYDFSSLDTSVHSSNTLGQTDKDADADDVCVDVCTRVCVCTGSCFQEELGTVYSEGSKPYIFSSYPS